MTEDTHDYDAFARILQTVYQEAHLHSPQGVPDVEKRLQEKLASHGVTLSTDIVRALAFAVVNGRDL